ncbi:trigger factor [Bacillota bacterium LX-D]|nr:trigger factor [Bacillota bacterium LX-D]
MKSEVEKIEKNRVALRVEVDAGEFEKAVQQAHKKLGKQVNIPGFRKGKVPRKVLERYIGKEALYNEASDIILPNAYYNAVVENELEPIDQPNVELVQAEEGKPFIFKATVEVVPEVNLGDYTNITVEKKVKEVTEADVDKYMANLQQRHAELVNVESGEVQPGDIVQINFEGFMDGKAFEGGKAENYSLTIGSNTFIPGFEDQILGMKQGEEKDINVTFPEDYHQKELAGKPALFKVRVNEIKRKELALLDDEFAKDVSEFDTLVELKNDARNKLKTTNETQAENKAKSDLIEKVIAQAEVEIPQVMIDRKVNEYLEDFKFRLQQQGLNYEQYLEYATLTEDKIKEDYRTRAEQRVKTELVLAAIAKKEAIVPSEEDVDKEIQEMAKIYNQTPDILKKYLEAQGNLEALKDSVKFDKTIEWLYSKAKVEAVSEEPKAQ